jgi:hypothetical protein
VTESPLVPDASWQAAPKPFERAFTVLVALSGVVAGYAAFWAAEAQNVESDARAEALALVIEANRANADGNLVVSSDNALWVQIQILLDEGRTDLANELAAQTALVSGGYVDEDLEPAAGYADFDAAWEAFVVDTFADYYQLWSDAEARFAEAQEASDRSLGALSATVLVALGTLFGTIGMSAGRRGVRVTMLALVALLLLLALATGAAA